MSAEDSFAALCDSAAEMLQRAKHNRGAPNDALDYLMKARFDVQQAFLKVRYLIKRGAKV